MNAFIDDAYTEANAIARRCHIYQYYSVPDPDAPPGFVFMEAFAFPLHCPGSPETNHLPGFRLEDLPDGLAEISRRAVQALGLTRGRVLFNVGRYPQHASETPAHYDGELFDYSVDPGVGNTVRHGLRPQTVAILTLRNETAECGTTLHDAEGKTIETHAAPGELLLFDNVAYQHGVPPTGANVVASAEESAGRWARYTIGYRALEDGYAWSDGRPLRPIRFEEAVEMHDAFLADDWAERLAEDLERATFPYPTRHV